MRPRRGEGSKVGDLELDEGICEEHAPQLPWELRLRKHAVSDVGKIEDDFGSVEKSGGECGDGGGEDGSG